MYSVSGRNLPHLCGKFVTLMPLGCAPPASTGLQASGKSTLLHWPRFPVTCCLVETGGVQPRGWAPTTSTGLGFQCLGVQWRWVEFSLGAALCLPPLSWVPRSLVEPGGGGWGTVRGLLSIHIHQAGFPAACSPVEREEVQPWGCSPPPSIGFST